MPSDVLDTAAVQAAQPLSNPDSNIPQKTSQKHRLPSPAPSDNPITAETTRPTSAASGPAAPAPRKSVSFSDSIDLLQPRPRLDDDTRPAHTTNMGGETTHARRGYDTAESSGDEITPIATRSRDGGRNYNTRTHEESPGKARAGPGAQGRTDTAPTPPANQETPQNNQGDTAPRQSRTPSKTPPHSQPRSHNPPDDAQPPRPKSRWKRFLEKHGTLELENKGSVARDHLALERTFLAWLRTSLSFASIGIAITQLFLLNSSLQDHAPVARHISPIGKPLGATFLAVGILVLLIGFHRYFESQHYVVLGRFPASRLSVGVVAGVTGGLVVVCLALVLGLAPEVVGE